MSTSLPSRSARSRAQLAISTGLGVGAALVDVGPGLLAQGDQLLDGRRPVDVAGGQGDAGAVLDAQVARQLGAGRRLARALEAGHEDDRRRARREGESRPAPPISAVSSSLTILTTCWPGLRWPITSSARQRSLTVAGERLDDLEVDVGLEQGETDLAHGRVDVVLGQRPALADAGQRVLELLGEGVEHRLRGYPALAVRPLIPGSSSC